MGTWVRKRGPQAAGILGKIEVTGAGRQGRRPEGDKGNGIGLALRAVRICHTSLPVVRSRCSPHFVTHTIIIGRGNAVGWQAYEGTKWGTTECQKRVRQKNRRATGRER